MVIEANRPEALLRSAFSISEKTAFCVVGSCQYGEIESGKLKKYVDCVGLDK